MTNNEQIPRRLSAILDKLKDQLGDADFKRLQSILPFFLDGPASFAKCLKELYEGKSRADAQTAFRKFRQKVNDAGEEHGLALECDTKLKSPAEERTCWWVGDDSKLLEELLAYGKAAISDIQLTEFIRPLALPRSGASLAAGSNRVRVLVFVSYAHADGEDVQDVLEELKRQTGPSEVYEFRYIADHAAIADDEGLPAGQEWHTWIQEAIATCDFGLLMISPAFLGSKYITLHELPPFRDGQKPMIPLVLDRVNFGVHNLNGLKRTQLFYFHPTPADLQLSYIECEKRNQRRNFAQALHTMMEVRLKDFKPVAADAGDIDSLVEEFLADTPREEITHARIIEELGRHLAPSKLAEFIRTFAKPISMRSDLQSLTAGKVDSSDAIDALTSLEAWASNPDAAPFYALLGEYGIGKTTTLKELTRILHEKHDLDPAIPVPIYIDLRNVIVPSGADAVPTLDEILKHALREWKLGNTKISLKPTDIIEAVQEHGTLIIFDGLDEVIVHLTPDRARRFIRELWRALPPFRSSLAPRSRSGKMIVSCRSHYFKDVWTQNSMFTGEGREGIKADDYSACILLPFTDRQIRDYLALTHDETKVAGILDLFHSIHNLADLAQRPYLLSEMSALVGELEKKKALDEPVLGVTLYELIVRKWLNRDGGKHHFSESDKRRMMEELAADMYRSGRREWEWPKVEQWLTDFLYRQPALADAYRGTKRELLNEDLRTATFILRPDDKQQHFRFAHTSLQEFFLASYLARSLREQESDHRPSPQYAQTTLLGMRASQSWDMPMPSLETLEFLGQLLALDSYPADLETMSAILAANNLRAATLAFRYWLLALEKQLPTPTPTHVNLAGADLDEWKIHGPLNLRGANFAGVRLNRARVENVDLTGADLTALEARQSLFVNVQAAGVKAVRVDFSGLQWRNGTLARADLSDAVLRCQWVDVDLGSAKLPVGWQRVACAIDVAKSRPPANGVLPMAVVGHSDEVNAAAWSPDGTQLASGSNDGTAKVWDASSGQCLLTIWVHGNTVWTCAWSPDGSRLLTGSDDKTAKIWDASNGRCLLTLQGHDSAVRSCAWSPDGSRLLTGSDDKTAKIWDASNGRCLRTLKGHGNVVRSCAWSPDGTRLASGSGDKTAKIWDASNGRCLLTLKAHEAGVWSCAWSPDGTRLASGSLDNTVKVCDTSRGQCLLMLHGHGNWVASCAWNPDGTRLISSSWDNSVKVWDASSGQCLLTLLGHKAGVWTCAWSPNGRLLVSGSRDKIVKVWDASSGQCLLTLHGQESRVSSFGWSPDGTRLFSRSHDLIVKEWNAATGECLVIHKDDRREVESKELSPDRGRRASASPDGAITLFNAASRKLRWTAYQFPDDQYAVFDAAGRITLASSEAWRYLAWRWFDPELGRHRLLPAETFGPLRVRHQVANTPW